MFHLSMQDMLEAAVHFGHQTRYWNPKMKPYIYTTRYSLHIINLEKTLPLFHEALKFLEQVAKNRGRILWVGTKHVAHKIVQEQATLCGMPYINYRWPGGMLTNHMTINNSVKRLIALTEQLDQGDTKGLTKKEILLLSRQRDKLERQLGGVKHMNHLPDALISFDAGQEAIAIREANRLHIPVVSIVDTNRDPDSIQYVIPGNDDSTQAILFYAQAFAQTIQQARQHTEQQDIHRIQQQTKKQKKKTTSSKNTASKTKNTASASKKPQDTPAVQPNDPSQQPDNNQE